MNVRLHNLGMVTDAEGDLSDARSLTNAASRGNGGGRAVPLSSDLRKALDAHRAASGTDPTHTRSLPKVPQDLVLRHREPVWWLVPLAWLYWRFQPLLSTNSDHQLD